MLKQRLVGALILVALGVVFWPIIFVQPGSDKEIADAPRIPPRPAVSTAPLEPPDDAGLRASPTVMAKREQSRDEARAVPTEPAPVVEPVAQQEARAKPPAHAPQTRTEAPRKLAIDSDGVPVAWILQVASVSTQEKADELRDALLAMDSKAYVKTVRSNGKQLYRVYVGPKFERAKLEQLQPQIDTRFGVTSMIARYVP
tara:strand:- start:17196 stop:17795 length:600 start_codon:yes stop_codon:yes gene_type:complete